MKPSPCCHLFHTVGVNNSLSSVKALLQSLPFTWLLIFMKLFYNERWKLPVVQKLTDWNRCTGIYKYTEAKEALYPLGTRLKNKLYQSLPRETERKSINKESISA